MFSVAVRRLVFNSHFGPRTAFTCATVTIDQTKAYICQKSSAQELSYIPFFVKRFFFLPNRKMIEMKRPYLSANCT